MHIARILQSRSAQSNILLRLDPGLAVFSFFVVRHSNFRISVGAAHAYYASVFARPLLLSTTLRFKEKHLLLDCSFNHQLQLQH
jgi:hypothetical protein